MVEDDLTQPICKHDAVLGKHAKSFSLTSLSCSHKAHFVLGSHSTHTLSSALHIRSDFWFLIFAYLYVSCFTMTTTVIMNVVYVYLLLSVLFFFLLIFLLQPFLPASSVWLQVKTESGDITLSIAFCPFFSLYFSYVLSCILSLFISFLFSGVFFPVLSPHLCERSSTLGVWIAGLWKIDLTCIQRSATSAHF